MGKGNKQRGNREAKKPKADKKLAPVSSTFLRPHIGQNVQGADHRGAPKQQEMAIGPRG